MGGGGGRFSAQRSGHGGLGAPRGVTHREGAGAGLCPPRNFPSSVKQSRNFHRNFHCAPVRRPVFPASFLVSPTPLLPPPAPLRLEALGDCGVLELVVAARGCRGRGPPHPPEPSPSQGAPEAARGRTGRRSPMSGCGRMGAPCSYRGWAGRSPYPPEMLVPPGMPLASQTLPQFSQRAGAPPR